MKINAELQNIIDEYFKKVEDKQDDILGLKRNIDSIISLSKQELGKVTKTLDKDFDENKISEEEYLIKFREEKEIIVKNTIIKLDSLVLKYDKMYSE